MEVKIDPTLPVRGVPFNSLHKLMIALYSSMPIRYTDALKAVVEDNIVSSVKGEPLKKSSFYHYWWALRLLGLIRLNDENQLYYLTSSGQSLIRLEPSTEDDKLSLPVKDIFREGMLTSHEIWRNFLVLFTGQLEPTKDIEYGGIVSFNPIPATKYKKPTTYRGYAVYSSKLENLEIPIEPRVYQFIVSGLRRWGQQCGLIDEIFPPITSRKFPNITSFMYLIDNDKERNLNYDDFTEFLRKYEHCATRIFETTSRFSIPELLSILCPGEAIHLTTAQRLLEKWVSKYSHHVALERPSIGLIEEQKGKRNKERLNHSQPWLLINGKVYTTMLVRTNILELEG